MSDQTYETSPITLPEEINYADLNTAHKDGTVKLADGTIKTEDDLFRDTQAEARSIIKEKIETAAKLYPFVKTVFRPI